MRARRFFSPNFYFYTCRFLTWSGTGKFRGAGRICTAEQILSVKSKG